MFVKLKRTLAALGVSLLVAGGMVPPAQAAGFDCSPASEIPVVKGVTIICPPTPGSVGDLEVKTSRTGFDVFLGPALVENRDSKVNVWVSRGTEKTTFPIERMVPVTSQVAVDAEGIVYVTEGELVRRFDGETGVELSSLDMSRSLDEFGGFGQVYVRGIAQTRLGDIRILVSSQYGEPPRSAVVDTEMRALYRVDGNSGLKNDGFFASRLGLVAGAPTDQSFSIRWDEAFGNQVFYDSGTRTVRLEGLPSGHQPVRLLEPTYGGDYYLITEIPSIPGSVGVFQVSPTGLKYLTTINGGQGWTPMVTRDGLLHPATDVTYFVNGSTGERTVISKNVAEDSGLGRDLEGPTNMTYTTLGLFATFRYSDGAGYQRSLLAKLNDARTKFEVMPQAHIATGARLGSNGDGLYAYDSGKGLMYIPNIYINDTSPAPKFSTTNPSPVNAYYYPNRNITIQGENLGGINEMKIGDARTDQCGNFPTRPTDCQKAFSTKTGQYDLRLLTPLAVGDYRLTATTETGNSSWIGTLKLREPYRGILTTPEAIAGKTAVIASESAESVDRVQLRLQGSVKLIEATFTNTATETKFVVPAGTPSGNYDVIVRKALYNGDTREADSRFTMKVTGVPVTIESMTPSPEVEPGQTVKITGSNLKSVSELWIVDEGQTKVSAASILSAVDSELSFEVPFVKNGTYDVLLLTEGGTQYSTNKLIDKLLNISVPIFELTSVSPSTDVLPEQEIAVTGTLLDTVDKVFIDGEASAIKSQTATTLVFLAPDAPRAKHEIFVSISGKISGTGKYLEYKKHEFSISNVTPALDVSAGDAITISGQGLDEITGIMIGNTTVTPSSKTSETLTFVAPAIPRRTYPIAVKFGKDSFATDFGITYLPISVGETAVVAPEEPQAGDEAAVTGEDLDRVTEVFVGGVPAPIVSQSPDEVRFTLPDAGDGSQEVVFIIDGEEVPAGQAINFGGQVIDTTFKVWTKRLNDTEAKMYAKNPVGMGKITFVLNGEEIAWIRAADASDPKLRVVTSGPMTGANYLVRTVQLNPGRNVLEIYQDGERIRRTIYSR